MKYLNLTEGFNPFSAPVEACIAFEAFTFNGGEPHIKIKGHIKENEHIKISMRMNSFNDLGLLLLAKDALNSMANLGYCDLLIPYFPGARQDRRMVEGEPLTVKVYADIINSMNFDKVSILDPHSDVTTALLNNVDIIPNYNLVRTALFKVYPTTEHNILSWGEEFHLISPDAGANKKINSLGIHLGAKSIIKCDKTRDVSNGKITGFEVYSDDLKGRTCILVDDICDAGGTFLGLSKELKAKNAGDIHLIVSHGIFSKGLHKLENEFKTVWTTDSISNQNYGLNTHCIKLKDML